MVVEGYLFQNYLPAIQACPSFLICVGDVYVEQNYVYTRYQVYICAAMPFMAVVSMRCGLNGDLRSSLSGNLRTVSV